MSFYEKQNPNERKYVCFVCGIAYTEIEEYREHILAEHEEGREFVKCPLVRCGFPVRDVRSHFKAKHPHEPIPQIGQMRALIWKDQRDPSKKSRKPTFKEGFYTSAKNGGKAMHYRSGWELQVYECLEKMDSVLGYAVEKIPITYFHNGESRTYFPDIIVYFHDGRKIVIEIKPMNQTTYQVNKDKWASAKLFCEERSWEFIVLTEKGIAQLKKGTLIL